MDREGIATRGDEAMSDSVPVPEEVLVTDPRARLTPAQVVERKLVALLQSVPLPMSRLEAAGPRRPVV